MNKIYCKSFSERYGHKSKLAVIKIKDDFPIEFRGAIIQLAKECGLNQGDIRDVICSILKKNPDPNNWSEYPNIQNENIELITNCFWFKVYDIAESLYKYLLYNKRSSIDAQKFEDLTNDFFEENGFGWKMEEGLIINRGEKEFENIINEAEEVLEESGLQSSKNELKEAIQDISRRPEPDITGAIQHSIACLECVCREVTGDKNLTLGKLIDRNPDIVPKPLDGAIEKIWGYSSEIARHLKEGRTPNFEEAELLVGLSVVLSTYLLKKNLK